MANVKMNNKRLLEKLQAEITIKLGKKMSQQDILDKSIEFTYNHLDDFLLNNIETPKISERLIDKIKNNTYKGPLEYPNKSDDELMYGL